MKGKGIPGGDAAIERKSGFIVDKANKILYGRGRALWSELEKGLLKNRKK